VYRRSKPNDQMMASRFVGPARNIFESAGCEEKRCPFVMPIIHQCSAHAFIIHIRKATLQIVEGAHCVLQLNRIKGRSQRTLRLELASSRGDLRHRMELRRMRHLRAPLARCCEDGRPSLSYGMSVPARVLAPALSEPKARSRAPARRLCDGVRRSRPTPCRQPEHRRREPRSAAAASFARCIIVKCN
jgi:hypothetical protein